MMEKKIKIYLPVCFHRIHTHRQTGGGKEHGTKVQSNFAGLKQNASLSKAKQVVNNDKLGERENGSLKFLKKPTQYSTFNVF